MYDHGAMVQTLAPYVHACPGPPLANKGLAATAFQAIPSGPESAPLSRRPERAGPRYLRSAKDVAEAINCPYSYLIRAASARGYSYGRAVRWVTLLHGLTLREEGLRWEQIAWRLRFNDAAGWTRFTRRLLRKTPAQLPRAPLPFWVEEAIRGVFLADALGDSRTA